jgi:hypothetical protein
MARILATSGGVTTEHDVGDRPLTVVVHDNGIRVDSPDFVEINPKNTIACMEQMTQNQWDWVSKGAVFKHLFTKLFERSRNPITIPATIEELNASDMGIIHAAGLIVLGVEAAMAGKSCFFRLPETYLHPAQQGNLVDVLTTIQGLGQGSGNATAVADPTFDAYHTVSWLKHMDASKPMAKVGSVTYTVADLILEIGAETDVGKLMVQKFVELRDGPAPPTDPPTSEPLNKA